MHRLELEALPDEEARLNRLCELNVAEQAANVCYTTIVQSAWRRGQVLTVNGFIYGLHDGLIRDLGFRVTSADEIPSIYNIR